MSIANQTQSLIRQNPDASNAAIVAMHEAAHAYRPVPSTVAKEAMMNAGVLIKFKDISEDSSLPDNLRSGAYGFVIAAETTQIRLSPTDKHRQLLEGAVALGRITREQADELIALAQLPGYEAITEGFVARQRLIAASQDARDAAVVAIDAALASVIGEIEQQGRSRAMTSDDVVSAVQA